MSEIAAQAPDAPPPEPGPLSDSAAEARLADLFAKSRGDDRRGEDGRFQAKEQPQSANDAVVEAPANDAEANPEPETAANDDETPAPDAANDEQVGETPEDGGDLPDLVDFEYGGQKLKIPKPLVEGAMRQQDYSKKTEEVAVLRRQALAEKLQAQEVAALAPYQAQAQNIVKLIESKQGQMPDPASDPVGYLTLDKELRGLHAELQQVQQAAAQRATELRQQRTAAEAELLQTGEAMLSRQIPGWGDALKAQIAKHAVERGYTPDELAQVYDPRFIALAHDAMKYRALQQARPAVQKQVRDAAPVVRPTGATNQAQSARSQAAQLVSQVRKTGKTGDAEAAMLALLRAAKKR